MAVGWVRELNADRAAIVWKERKSTEKTMYYITNCLLRKSSSVNVTDFNLVGALDDHINYTSADMSNSAKDPYPFSFPKAR